MPVEKRRSDRILLTIPLVVHQTDSTGDSSSEGARSVAVNRHGARIQIAHSLKVGQVVRIVNQVSRRSADFRVVGPVAPRTDEGGEWGVECVDAKANIWGIQFPPVPGGGDAASRALLECRTCHTVSLLPLSLVEVDVLETAGILSKPCPSCTTATPWGYAEKQVAMGAPPGETAMLEAARAQVEEPKGERRRHRRVCLQLPALVRDFYGGVEITKSENVSKGGFCFASDKNYFMGQGIMVICPYNNTSEQNIEVKARIVRRHQIEGMQRKLYGVRYRPQGA
jgi:hypothetical protein